MNRPRPRCSEHIGKPYQCRRDAEYRVLFVGDGTEYVRDDDHEAPYCSDHAAARKRFGEQFVVVGLRS